MLRGFLTFIILLTGGSNCFAVHKYLEKEYQNKWCSDNNGVMEYRLNDTTRIDCLTQNYAIEFDFANKWAEAIGQSLYYSLCTNKKAGIVLILENGQKDVKYLNRLNKVANKYNIKIWTIVPQDLLETKPCSNIK